MDKDQALNDFLQGLHIVMNNASAYFKEHPYFIKSVETFKEKVDVLSGFQDPIIIEVTPNSLFIDEKYWDKSLVYTEIASMLHLRKIKGLVFRKGVAVVELVNFLSSLCQPAREVLRQGGIKNILEGQKYAHLDIEELDYSELLLEEESLAEESKDIWAYLFRHALEKKDPAEINMLADDFGKIIARFKANDLFKDDELGLALQGFLGYLKDNQKDKFNRCAWEIFRVALKYKHTLSDENLGKIKDFFKDFNADEFGDLLWGGISGEENFDISSFELFSRLTDEEKHKRIASYLLGRVYDNEALKNSPKAIIKNIHGLLSVSNTGVISETYRNTLSSLLQSISFDKAETFDSDALRMNYRFILFNLLDEENNKERLGLMRGALLKECDSITEERNLKDLKLLWDTLDKKIKQDASLEPCFEEIEKSASNFIENMAFQEQPPADLEYFFQRLKRKSSLGFDFYCDRIFKEGKVNSFVLRLFLKLFPLNEAYIYEMLKDRRADISFLIKIVKGLEGVDTFMSLELLKKIFYLSDNLVKIEALKSMRGISARDNEFLFSILSKGELFLKKEALAILAKDEGSLRIALDNLLSMPSPLGIKNKLILENITVIEELGYTQASENLNALSKRHFVWNRSIRHKAAEVLKKWNVREN